MSKGRPNTPPQSCSVVTDPEAVNDFVLKTKNGPPDQSQKLGAYCFLRVMYNLNFDDTQIANSCVTQNRMTSTALGL